MSQNGSKGEKTYSGQVWPQSGGWPDHCSSTAERGNYSQRKQLAIFLRYWERHEGEEMVLSVVLHPSLTVEDLKKFYRHHLISIPHKVYLIIKLGSKLCSRTGQFAQPSLALLWSWKFTDTFKKSQRCYKRNWKYRCENVCHKFVNNILKKTCLNKLFLRSKKIFLDNETVWYRNKHCGLIF